MKYIAALPRSFLIAKKTGIIMLHIEYDFQHTFLVHRQEEVLPDMRVNISQLMGRANGDGLSPQESIIVASLASIKIEHARVKALFLSCAIFAEDQSTISAASLRFSHVYIVVQGFRTRSYKCFMLRV